MRLSYRRTVSPLTQRHDSEPSTHIEESTFVDFSELFDGVRLVEMVNVQFSANLIEFFNKVCLHGKFLRVHSIGCCSTQLNPLKSLINLQF